MNIPKPPTASKSKKSAMFRHGSSRVLNSRNSLSTLLSQRSFSKSTTGSSRTLGGFSDSRCYKHSPRVGQVLTHVSEELAGFEAEKWREAFAAMGGLRKLGVKAPSEFTILNDTPYHCECTAREFKVRYGDIIKLQPPVFRQTKKMDRPQICNCIAKEVLPIASERKLNANLEPTQSAFQVHEPIKVKHYLPKSRVIVRWDPLRHSNVDKICEWITSVFGPFLFTIRTAVNSMIVAFETMEQAHCAVNFHLQKSSKIHISWHDPSLNNFGHFVKNKDYTVSNDPVWIRYMEEKLRTRPRGIGTQPGLDPPGNKPKRLKITESISHGSPVVEVTSVVLS